MSNYFINDFFPLYFVITLSFKPRQAIEVSKRQAKVRETPGNAENAMKLEAAETKLQDLKTNMAILGKEAAAAMAAVEAQQQRLTLQRLIAMVLQFYHMILQFFCFKILDLSYQKLLLPLKSSVLFLLSRLKQSVPIIKEYSKYLISLRER